MSSELMTMMIDCMTSRKLNEREKAENIIIDFDVPKERYGRGRKDS